jgi:opacity protein-like surface antigen
MSVRADVLGVLTIMVGLGANAGLATPASAAAGDGWGLGIGTGLGVHSSGSPNNPGDSGVIADLNVRARFLWILGLDLRFNLQDDDAFTLDDSAQYAARYRTSLLLYVVPTPILSVYVGGGIGAIEGSDLLDPRAEGSSYQAGLGIEVPVTARLALDASFMMIMPGEKSVERDIDRRVDLELAAYRAAPTGNVPTVPTSVPTGDYVSPKNFELMLRAMMVF